MKRASGIQFSARIPVTIEREGDVYVSSCAPLDVYSQGDSEQEAVHNLIEAVQLFLETCFEMGTLDDVLHDCGFVPANNNKTHEQQDDHFVDVPLPLLVARRHATHHAR